MKKAIIICLFCFSKMLWAQEPVSENELIGTWSLVSITNIYQDGTRVQPYGNNPDGILIFDKKGNYTIQILRAQRPLIATGNKNTSTPDENAALVQGYNGHYGTYTVEANNKIIVFRITHAFFPNWEHKIQKRTYSYKNNEIKYIVTNTTQGGQSVVAEVVWRRR